MAVDLHCHSTASDGTLPPASVVALAVEHGVTTLALTDHDTIDGVAEAVHAGADHGVRVIPGVEISTGTPFGRTMHLIALFADPDPPGLAQALAENRARRDERIDLILARLAALGPEISRERVDAHATGTVARPHIAAALVDAGHCSSVQDAMDRYLGDHRPADVPHRGLDGAAAVRLVRELGGAPIVAHPGTLRLGTPGWSRTCSRWRRSASSGSRCTDPSTFPASGTSCGASPAGSD
ncbi:MAG: PHP domain-containing protein [Actinobacteria bacterium]|nr:PHP domain-containing protein [Thermoleophilia bacterium]MCB9011830.1 PHP domain-containing protein [Actinomycetota bacterium]